MTDNTVTAMNRVLDPVSPTNLDGYLDGEGGQALESARRLGAFEVTDMIEAAGLRGRGGAGFPTAAKWRTVSAHGSGRGSPIVVVNAAEGEPGSLKDRALLARNPYKVLEGALIAATAVDADRVVVATKGSFDEVAGLRQAVEEVRSNQGFRADIDVELVAGPDEYLFGEETALLEVVNGRPAFPRVTPPWRLGPNPTADSGSVAATALASTDSANKVPPALVNNVETLAHVCDIVRRGPTWFRENGIAGAPGTFLCTVTGDTIRHAVVELPVGITLGEVAATGGGGLTGEPLAAMSGVSHPLIPARRFDEPLGYEVEDGFAPIGSGAFRFFTTGADVVAVAAGIARFLAIESCGQCIPCKRDGLALHDRLTELAGNEVSEDANSLDRVADLARTVTDGARCALAGQFRSTVESLLEEFPESVAGHLDGQIRARPPVRVVPIISIEEGTAVFDNRHLDRQPDWTYEPTWSGRYPAQAVDVRQGPASVIEPSPPSVVV